MNDMARRERCTKNWLSVAPRRDLSWANCRRTRLNSVGLQSSISVLRDGSCGVSNGKIGPCRSQPVQDDAVIDRAEIQTVMTVAHRWVMFRA